MSWEEEINLLSIDIIELIEQKEAIAAIDRSVKPNYIKGSWIITTMCKLIEYLCNL